MKKILLISLFFGLLGSSYAQSPVYNNALRVSVEATNKYENKVQMQRHILRYSVGYHRKLSNSRWLVDGSLSYLQNHIREKASGFDASYIGTRSQRISADVAALYNILKSPRHTLQLGAGPSLWYQRNELETDVTIRLNGGQEVDKITVERTKKPEVVLGFNLQLAYEYAITPQVGAGVRAIILSNLTKPEERGAIPNNFLATGVHVSYWF
ncbi:hypothetical protein GCM10027347_41790 [Larkinella harenae]